MAEALIIPKGASKSEVYETILPQIKSVIEGEGNLIANLANVAAILKEAFGFFWAGFYLMDGNQLVLGPFQGPLACTRIPVRPIARGVCGKAAVEQVTLVVEDVDQFPGHIACSSTSRSEIVVPLIYGGETKLVLDIDSKQLDDFDEIDQDYCEKIIDLIRQNNFSKISSF